mgnify:CR=1 FL=1
MTESSVTKKRKSCETSVAKNTLFVLQANVLKNVYSIERYLLFTSGENVEIYDKICEKLRCDMKSAANGWSDVADAERTWVPLMMFYTYDSTYHAAKHKGYKDAEDYQKKRNQKARNVMLPIGMIHSIKELQSDNVGCNFIKEDIGEFKFISNKDVMSLEDFTYVMFVPANCNEECQKYYCKIENGRLDNDELDPRTDNE